MIQKQISFFAYLTLQIGFIFLPLNFAQAMLPEVKYFGYSDGCNIFWHTGGFYGKHEFGSHRSGTVMDSIDWSHCAMPAHGILPEHNSSTHPYLFVRGAHSFDTTTGLGQANLTVHIESLKTNHTTPYKTIHPSGGGKLTIGLNLHSSPHESDQSLTFLIDRQPLDFLSGSWIVMENGIRISLSLRKQLEIHEPSLIYCAANADLREVIPSNPFRSQHFEYVVPYRVVSPKYCTLTDRLNNPVADFDQLSAERVIQTLVCVGLIPDRSTGEHLLWSKRKSQIRPKLRALEEFIKNPIALCRFNNPEFQNLAVEIANEKLRQFYRWAIDHYGQDLTRQVAAAKDLSRLLNSKNNPFSYRRMIEAFKTTLTDSEIRRRLAQDLVEINRERTGLSDDARYLSILNQIDHLLSQPNLVEEESLNGILHQIELLAQAYEDESLELTQEREEYASKQ